jgi:hypothetical protein
MSHCTTLKMGHTQHGDFINLFSFFQNKECGPELFIENYSVDAQTIFIKVKIK